MTRTKLRALLAEATPSPWEAWVPAIRGDEPPFFIGPFANHPVEIMAPEVEECVSYLRPWNRPQDEADARLIAAARNALPVLLDVLDAAEAALRQVANCRNAHACPTCCPLAEGALARLRELAP